MHSGMREWSLLQADVTAAAVDVARCESQPTSIPRLQQAAGPGSNQAATRQQPSHQAAAAHRILDILVATNMGLWFCTRTPSGAYSASSEREKASTKALLPPYTAAEERRRSVSTP